MPSITIPRPRRGRAHATVRCRWVFAPRVATLLLAPLALGCATFGSGDPLPAEVAASRELCRQGVAAMEREHWQQAEILLQRAVDASPDDAEARRNLAEVLWHRGAVDEAIAQITAAVRLEPRDVQLSVRAGEMSLARGASDDALLHAEHAIRLDPKQAEAWALRGRVFRHANRTDRAMADLQRALELAPSDVGLLLDVALLYHQRGQPARALGALHHLLDVYPPGAEPQMALMLEGQALMDLGRPRQAAESFVAAARRGPPNAELLYRLAQAQWSAGQYAEATAAAEQALAIDGTHQASRALLLQLASRESTALR